MSFCVCVFVFSRMEPALNELPCPASPIFSSLIVVFHNGNFSRPVTGNSRPISRTGFRCPKTLLCFHSSCIISPLFRIYVPFSSKQAPRLSRFSPDFVTTDSTPVSLAVHSPGYETGGPCPPVLRESVRLSESFPESAPLPQT